MTDMQASLDKIRSDAAECLLLSSLVPNDKREMFVKIAEHLNSLAFEAERTMTINGVRTAPAADQPEPVVTDLAKTHHQQASRSRRILAWLLVIFAAAVAGAFFWENKHVGNYLALLTEPSKHEPPLALGEETKHTIAAHVSGEQGGQLIAEQLGALAARVDDLERELDSLKKASAEIVERSNKEPAGAGEKLTSTESRSSGPWPENPAAAKQSSGAPPTRGNPASEPVDQVGAIAIPAGAELDRRRGTTGPTGCTHFRSFDAVSGTYTTLDGRRRPCR